MAGLKCVFNRLSRFLESFTCIPGLLLELCYTIIIIIRLIMGYRVTVAGKNARGNAPPLWGIVGSPGWFFGNYLVYMVGLGLEMRSWLETRRF